MPRREVLYLVDMLEAIEAIGRFLTGITKDRFIHDDLLRSAVLQKLAIIGEAVAQLPADVKLRHPEVEWQAIKDFRNFVIHVYFAIDWNIIWTTAIHDVPSLKPQIEQILKRDALLQQTD